MHDHSAGRTKSRLLRAALALTSVCMASGPALAQLPPTVTRLLEAQSVLGTYGKWTLSSGSNVSGDAYCFLTAASQSWEGSISYRAFPARPIMAEWIVSPSGILDSDIETINVRSKIGQAALFDKIFVVQRAGSSIETRQKYWFLLSELTFDDLERFAVSGGAEQYIHLYYPDGGIPDAPFMEVPMIGFPEAVQEMSKCLGRPTRTIIFNSRWAKVVRVAKQLCGIDAQALERNKPVAIVEDSEADLAVRYCRGVSR